jgi:hypothetical protein
MRISVVLVYVVVVICLWSSVHADENIIVHTTYGDILGYQTNMARVFYGIPYAQPPIGELRFVIISNVFYSYIIFLIIADGINPYRFLDGLQEWLMLLRELQLVHNPRVTRKTHFVHQVLVNHSNIHFPLQMFILFVYT